MQSIHIGRAVTKAFYLSLWAALIGLALAVGGCDFESDSNNPANTGDDDINGDDDNDASVVDDDAADDDSADDDVLDDDAADDDAIDDDLTDDDDITDDDSFDDDECGDISCEPCPPDSRWIDDGSCCGQCTDVCPPCEPCPPGTAPANDYECCAECVPVDDCDNIACSDCAPDWEWFDDGSCCGQCIPPDDCDHQCEPCPEGFGYLDDGSCCGSCEDCSMIGCAPCPPGYEPIYNGTCCGECAPTGDDDDIDPETCPWDWEINTTNRGQVEIIITNAGDEPIYFDAYQPFSLEGENPFTGERSYFSHSYMCGICLCDDIKEGMGCAVCGGMYPAVIRLEPAQTMSRVWTGQRWDSVPLPQWCDEQDISWGECALESQAEAGEYELLLTFAPEAETFDGQEQPDPNGGTWIGGAYLSGSSITVSQQFAYPTEGLEFTIDGF